MTDITELERLARAARDSDSPFEQRTISSTPEQDALEQSCTHELILSLIERVKTQQETIEILKQALGHAHKDKAVF